MRWLYLLLASFALVACGYLEVKREIGYKGKARLNPWLAAERFSAEYAGKVHSVSTWVDPDENDSVWFIPASSLGNLSFTRRVDDWVRTGGHLVLLIEHATAETSDWSMQMPETTIEPALSAMLEHSGILLSGRKSTGVRPTASSIDFNGRIFQVSAKSVANVAVRGGNPGVFASVPHGMGRMTVLTDARLFRNRWIDQNDHAALLEALIRATGPVGAIGFMRGTGLSLWGLLANHFWPVLIGLAVLVVLWLWKSFTRFGPLESADGMPSLRIYEHHLEALGGFQWRLDGAAGLLGTLRAQVWERRHHLIGRTAAASESEFLQRLAERSGVPIPRVREALVGALPSDPASLTRMTADLQRLLKVPH